MTKNKFEALKNQKAPVTDELERSKAGNDDLVMFSARITREDQDYIKHAAFFGKKTNQEILAEAIALYRKAHPLD